jgi:hypothetical protein
MSLTEPDVSGRSSAPVCVVSIVQSAHHHRRRIRSGREDRGLGNGENRKSTRRVPCNSASAGRDRFLTTMRVGETEMAETGWGRYAFAPLERSGGSITQAPHGGHG